MHNAKTILSLFAIAALLSPGAAMIAQNTNSPSTAPGVIQVTTELVLVNVVARDKKGNVIKDLKKEGFTLY